MSLLRSLFGGGGKVPPDQTRAILDRHLSADFRVFPLAERPSPAAAVLEVTKRLDVRLPPEVVAHLTGQFPGIYVEAKEAVWPRPRKFDVGPFWSFLYAVQTFTVSAESESWMRMESAAKDLYETTGVKAAPVLKVVGDADVYCVDGAGKLVRIDHETGQVNEIDLGFFALLDREIGELRKRTERKKRTRES